MHTEVVPRFWLCHSVTKPTDKCYVTACCSFDIFSQYFVQ